MGQIAAPGFEALGLPCSSGRWLSTPSDACYVDHTGDKSAAAGTRCQVFPTGEDSLAPPGAASASLF